MRNFRNACNVLILAGALLVNGAVLAQAPADPTLATLAAAIEKARAEQVDVLAPGGFQEVAEAYDAALRDSQRGRNAERVRTRASEALAALQTATKSAAAARDVLSTVLKTRTDAVNANAPKLAPELWQKAAERFTDAARAAERNDLKNAQRRAAEAEVLLRDVELTAIKSGLLNEARALIAQADQTKVADFAPRSLQAAKRLLAQADQEITRNRYDISLPQSLAAEAAYEARHSLYLTRLIQGVRTKEDDDQAGIEELILSWEDPLRSVAAEMDQTARFDNGVDKALRDMLTAAQKQRQEARNQAQELRDRNEQITALNAEVQRLESRLGGVSQERVALQRRVDAQERLRTNVARIETSFTPNEARVQRQGDDVVISLLGIKFPSGRSTIDSGSTPLMNKVQQALALFPDTPVVVEGHTDSNGSDSTNLVLSQDRADAVKQYLVSTVGLNPERVSSIGYGEARPVSTNETNEGRARNRRIDLVLRVNPAQ